MRFKTEKLSREEIETNKFYWEKFISNHLNKEIVKTISQDFGISLSLCQGAILRSLQKIGWRPGDAFENHHLDWLKLVKLCVNEKNLIKRWTKSKGEISKAVNELYSEDRSMILEALIEDTTKPLDMLPVRNSPFAFLIPNISYVDYLIKTVIFFNTRDCKLPKHVILHKWKMGDYNFCDWEFRRDGTLFEFELINGETRIDFIPKLNRFDLMVKMYGEKASKNEQPFCLDKSHNLIKLEVQSILKDFGVKIGNHMNPIQQLFQHVGWGAIQKWLKKEYKLNFNNLNEFEKNFTEANNIIRLQHLLKPYFPKYYSEIVSFKLTGQPKWIPENRHLDLDYLKRELAGNYLEKLEITELENHLDKLCSHGVRIFEYESFRKLLNEWEKNGKYEKINDLLNRIKKRYSHVNAKKIQTLKSYALWCVWAIKIKKDNNCSFNEACRILSKKIEQDQQSIRRRAYHVSKIEGLELLDEDFKSLEYRLSNRYNISDNEIMKYQEFLETNH